MPYCVDCGVEIPPGQRICSTCCGDPEYGRDGIYAAWLEQQALQEELQDTENEVGH